VKKSANAAEATPLIPPSAPARPGLPSDPPYTPEALSAERDDDTSAPGADLRTFTPFDPREIGVYRERFFLLAQRLGQERTVSGCRALIRAEAASVSGQGGAPGARLKYRAALGVLEDLLGQGWEWRYRRPHLELVAPNFTSAPHDTATILRQKEEIRRSMETERLAQLRVPSTRRFIAEMETPRRVSGRDVSILDLVADGEVLAGKLRVIERRPEAERQALLDDLIRPSLQLIDGEARCSETGFRLIDIWRYFRYTWSLPYFSTPGRNLFYLVRDTAQACHPVIGIAALGNSIVRLADRERWIGWSIEEVEGRLRDAAAGKGDDGVRSLATALISSLEFALTQINPRGLVTAAELRAPTPDVVGRLCATADENAERRLAHLRDHEVDIKERGADMVRKRPRGPEKQPLGITTSTLGVTSADWSVEALYVQKRATDLADLLRAKMAFVAAKVADDPVAGLQALVSTENGCRALTAVIRATKRQHIGSSMMDVIICGAVPPYTHLLGGKLVCMLLASPQVRLEYRDRYSDAPSAIASKMKGSPVAKAADLVLLGTTSLYHVGSSQYNRVKIPADIAGGEGTIRYEELGATRGYGSVHLSEETRRLLEAVVRQDNGALLITRTFGEGVSPKLRLMREGLQSIGLNQDTFLQHQCRRIIYGVALAKNAQAYLRGEEATPDWYIPAATLDDARTATAAIAQFWSRRWLRVRATNHDVLQRVSLSRPADLLMSIAADRGGSAQAPSGDAAESGSGTGSAGGPVQPPPQSGPLGVAFVQQLYNHRSCYADRLTPAQLAAIHIETPLERFITKRLHAGDDVILTGNPGDGKTHLLRRLHPTLEGLGAECHLDASAEASYDVIIEAWRRARRRKKPFCLAVNEWPLLELVREFEDSFPPLRSVKAQVDRTIVYDDGDAPADGVIVIDLNNRSIVDRQTVVDVVFRLTDDRFYSECAQCPGRETCAVPRARRALRTPRVHDRLYRLLDLAVRRGAHATMRDLQGFVAFLITGGLTCEELIAADAPAQYFESVFQGDSDLFAAVSQAFDPARMTHPVHDEALWEGTLPPEGWADPTAAVLPAPGALPGAEAQLDAMRALKRRFFFEHADGESLLSLLPEVEQRFDDIVSGASGESEGMVRFLLGLINRFFDPRERSDAALRIWTTHHYDARWSPTYLSTRSLGAEGFTLQVPRLASHVAGALTYRPDHAVLVAKNGDRVIGRLRIDLTLVRALYDAKRGLPMALRSPQVLKRLELFFSGVGQALRSPHAIEDIHIKNFETGADLHLKVDRQNRRFNP